MHYRLNVAQLLGEIIERLRAIDRLTDECTSHRLDHLEPLAIRLEGLAVDIRAENSFVSALRKSNELRTLLGGNLGGLKDPKYRSAIASLLGSYQRSGMPEKARLGGLRGGWPRKDGRPTMTLERKGYSAQFLPAKKNKLTRVHPPLEKVNDPNFDSST